MFKKLSLLTSLGLALSLSGGVALTPQAAATSLSYQKAPSPLDKVLDAPFLPALSVSPDQRQLLLLEQRSLPELSELAETELRLAGLRLNPENHAPSRSWYYIGLQLLNLDGSKRPVKGLPESPRLSDFSWSPDGQQVAFLHTAEREVQLWVLSLESGRAHPLKGLQINNVYGTPFVWSSNSKSLIVKTVSHELPKPPAHKLPEGPVIYENSGKASPGRTYQDLLKSPDDEARFEFYLHSQLVEMPLRGEARPLGKPGLISRFALSPDGRYLLVQQLHRPFSYLFPAFRFPLLSEIWNRKGELVKTVADQPLADKIPISFDAVRTGPRGLDWRADAEATLYWTEALDQGDPEQATEYRDQLMLWPAPFDQAAVSQLRVPHRLDEIFWGHDQVALALTDWYQTREKQYWRFAPLKKLAPEKILSYSGENRYQDPGKPLERRNSAGKLVLQFEDAQAGQETVLMSGDGASPEGDRPFLRSWNLKSGMQQELWRSQAPYFEKVVRVLEQGQLLTRRESPDRPPNYFVRDLKQQNTQALTDFPHPLPEFSQIKKQLIEYERADGVKLNATLYLPPGYKPEDGPLPTVVWAYPREFKSADAASQVQGSPFSFVNLSPWSPLVFLTQGYAVVDHPAMPIIGEGDKEPNDSYIKQLVANAQAVVDKVSAMGVADPKRIGVGGHSYGAFMTANLLTHSDLFRAGIARSGAYNRTLTPFGFQSEQRKLWEAPEVYLAMSPLMHADKLNQPLLMIHGDADDNSGTYPMQSLYYYQAIKGLGGHVRLVMLPFESHGYRAQPSMHHMLWEMVKWFDTHVKNAK